MKITTNNLTALKGNMFHFDSFNIDEHHERLDACLNLMGFHKWHEVTPKGDYKDAAFDVLTTWDRMSQAVNMWLNLQDDYRDYWVQREIRESREIIKVYLPKLRLSLLELAETIGRAYDK